MKTPSPTLLADRMLGRLSKWLRIMGVDCAYVREGEQEDIIERALSEQRVLLTRDTRLIKRKRLGLFLFVESDHLENQLIQVLGHFEIDPMARAFSRCIRCNRELEEADPKEAGARLPVHVQDTQKRVARCPDCKRFYWPATHITRMGRRLTQIAEATMAKK